MTAHAEFHHTLLDGCANQRLKNTAASLRQSAELYRRRSVPFGGDSGRDLVAEQAAILAAAVARDPEQAVLRLSTHAERTTSILLASLADQARPPEPA